MSFSFSYNKGKVLQALRYHFFWQKEIRILLVIILIFDIATAVMYIFGKIRPEPFLLGSFIWMMFILSIWYILPYSVYKKAPTFKESFIIYFLEDMVRLQNARGEVEWPWGKFTKMVESPNFFHFYFSSKSFFLVPKDQMNDSLKYSVRALVREKITTA